VHTPFVSIKGDPSLRETVPLRPRQQSRLDQIAGEVLQACAALLRDTGVYAIYIGFNSSEVRTESIFNPFAYEVHDDRGPDEAGLHRTPFRDGAV
jgi:hypothetical protein